VSAPDGRRRVSDLLRGFADVFAAWWLGFSDEVTEADVPEDDQDGGERAPDVRPIRGGGPAGGRPA
jgi:hypothetical protein